MRLWSIRFRLLDVKSEKLAAVPEVFKDLIEFDDMFALDIRLDDK